MVAWGRQRAALEGREELGVDVDEASAALILGREGDVDAASPGHSSSSLLSRKQFWRLTVGGMAMAAPLLLLYFVSDIRFEPKRGVAGLDQVGLRPLSLSSSASCGVPEEGMNNRGTNIKSVSASDAASCCNECLKVAECTGYTLVKDSGECWLKSMVEAPESDGSAISGSVIRLAAPDDAPEATTAPEEAMSSSSAEGSVEASSGAEKMTPPGTLPLTVEECSKASGCKAVQLSVTLDQNWRWYYHPSSSTSCKPCGQTNCTDCVLQEEVDYADYGASVGSEDGKSLSFTKNIRTYLLDASGEEYYMASLVGKEMSYDVDMSRLPCGTNSAMYFVEMPKDGGHKGGAKLGTGYCDAQCPKDGSTLEGKPAVGEHPMCCNEFDIWEANRAAEAVTTHVCQTKDGRDVEGAFECEGQECKSRTLEGVCDGFGCDFNPYRNGAKKFYRKGAEATGVDTSKPFTVTTQLVADIAGKLTEVKRFFTQDGKRSWQPAVELEGREFDSLTDEYCEKELRLYNKSTSGRGDVCNSEPVGARIFTEKGGLEAAGRSFDRGNVLVLSLWNDPECHMIWLDGDHGDGPGGSRGPCRHADSSELLGKSDAIGVTFSNLRFGDIGSTA